MATLEDKNFTADYSGLATNVYLSLAVGGICLLAFEVLRQIPRRRGRPSASTRQPSGWWRAFGPSKGRPTTLEGGAHERESWEFGYVYQARHWAVPDAPLLPRLPLVWIWDSVRTPEASMPPLCGLDHTVHTRFLRCCLWYLLLQTCTTLPILLPIHLTYAPADVSRTSMLRASLSSLIKSSSGQRWIWVHCVLIVWLLGTWVAGLVWVAWGGLKYRRQAVESTLHQARLDAASKRREPDGLPRAKPTAARVGYPAEGMIASGGGPPKSSALCPNGASDDGGDSDGGLDNADDGKTGPRGWKHRTVLVANIPPDMRDPDVLRAYFSDGLRGVLKRRARKARARAQGNAGQGGVAARIAKRARTSADGREGVGLRDDPSEEDDLDGDDAGFAGEEGGRTGVVEDVVVVRRLLELHKLRERRLDVLGQLEQAHVVLGRNVLGALAAWRRAEGKDGAEPPTAAGEKAVGAADDEKDVGAGFYGDAQDWTETERMIILDRELGRFLDVEADGFWTALHSLPRALLDRYQPQRYGRLSPALVLQRRPNAPLIDYLSAKLALLSLSIDDSLSAPLAHFTPSSSAFVTFCHPEVARLAVRKMGRHHGRALCCNVAMAPDYHDLEWYSLMSKEFRIDALKGFVVSILIWAFIIVWVIPLSFFVALVSVKNLGTIIPALQRALDDHPRAAEVATSLVPTILVSILTLLIPLLLFLISTHLETIVTKSALHDIILNRYYRFLICEVVVFFCIGAATLQTFIVSFKSLVSIDLLETIAQSFPQAAPFYAGWLILETSLHSFFELGMFGLPMLQWIFARRKDIAPRKRANGTNPRFFSAYYLVPVHSTVLFISNLFAVLNPLVIPFGLIYFVVAHAILKNQFIHVYQSQYDTNGQRPTIRFMRYTLDGLILTEVVYMAMNIILKKSPLIAVSVLLVIITAAIKISLTRAIKARYAALDVMEADGLFAISRGLDLGGAEQKHDRSTAGPGPAATSHALEPCESISSSDDAHGPQTGGVRTIKMFNAWRSGKTKKNKQGGYLNVPANRMSMSTAPLRYARDDDSDDDDDDDDVAEREMQPQTGAKSASSTPTRRKTLSRRMQNMSSHMVHPILDRIDARFLPPSHDERPSPIDESRSASPALAVRPGFPNAAVEEAALERLVRPRVGPQPWNDAPRDDRLYSYQPPYQDGIATTLWLPRHPLSKLDLDDTVDLKLALESSAGGGGDLGAASDLFTLERSAGADVAVAVLQDSPDRLVDESPADDPSSPGADESILAGLPSPASAGSTRSADKKGYFLSIPTPRHLSTTPDGLTPTGSRLPGRTISIRDPSRSPTHPPLSPSSFQSSSSTPPRRASGGASHQLMGPRSPLSPSSFRTLQASPAPAILADPIPPPVSSSSAGGSRRPCKPKGPRDRSNTVATHQTGGSGGGEPASNASYLQELLAEEAERQRKDREEEAETYKREGTRQKHIGRRATINSR